MIELLLPIGLLGLLGLVALILIYILKPKFQERKVSSSFIWKLSLSYKRRKMPFEWLTTSLLFFVQVLAITLIALMLAQPLIAHPVVSGDKIVILDGSASMKAATSGRSRFERAKEEIRELARKQTESDSFTLIFAGEIPHIVVDRSDNPDEVLSALETLQCTDFTDNIPQAMELANEVMRSNPSAGVYLYTDHNYNRSGYVEVKNVALTTEWNVAVVDAHFRYLKGRYVFYSTIGSYGRASTLTISLSIDIDGVLDGNGNRTYEVELLRPALSLKDGEEREIIWENPVLEFSTARVEILDFGGAKDSFSVDDSFEIYGGERRSLRIQIVSDLPVFLQSALLAAGQDYSLRTVNADLSKYDPALWDVVKPHTENYGLYVYDSILPLEFPKDGASWVVNPQVRGTSNTMPYEANMTIESYTTFTTAPKKMIAEVNNSTPQYATIMSGVDLEDSRVDPTVTAYTKFANYDDCNIIVRAEDGTPLIFTKKIGQADLIVFAFPLSYSTIVMTTAWPKLVANIATTLVRYTTDKLAYSIGEEVEIHPLPNASKLEVSYNGHIRYSKDSAEAVSLTLEKLGTYLIIQTLNGQPKIEKVFVKISHRESNFNYIDDFLASEEYVDPATGQSVKRSIDRQKSIDLIYYIAIGLLALFVIEWGLQYRELH